MRFGVLLPLIIMLWISMPVFSVALGVSPSTKKVCMGPEETREVYLYPSTDSEVPIEIEILIEGGGLEINGSKKLILKPSSTTEYKIKIRAREEGAYNSSIYFCSSLDDVLKVKECIKVNLLTNVTKNCSLEQQTIVWSIDNKSVFLLALIFFAVFVVLYVKLH